MSKLKRGIAILAVILTLATVFSAIAIGVSAVSYDMSHPGSDGNVTLFSSDVLERYLSEELSLVETEFLKKYGRIKISYNGIVTTDNVSVSFSDTGVSVVASEYTYKSAS